MCLLPPTEASIERHNVYKVYGISTSLAIWSVNIAKERTARDGSLVTPACLSAIYSAFHVIASDGITVVNVHFTWKNTGSVMRSWAKHQPKVNVVLAAHALSPNGYFQVVALGRRSPGGSDGSVIRALAARLKGSSSVIRAFGTE